MSSGCDIMYSMMTTVKYCIANFKGTKKVNLKSSHHKKNYLVIFMLTVTRLTLVIIYIL